MVFRALSGRLRDVRPAIGWRPVRGVITIYNRPFTPQDHDAITANMIVMGKVSGGRVTYAYEEDAKRFLMQRRKQA